MSPSAWGSDSPARLGRLYRFGLRSALAHARRTDGYGDSGKALLSAARTAGPLSFQAVRSLLDGYGSAADLEQEQRWFPAARRWVSAVPR